MFTHNLSPIIFNLGFLEIRWYSVAYITGILIGWWLGKKILSQKINRDNNEMILKSFDDLIAYLIISMILGGRLGYILFYNFPYYYENPIAIFKIWEGGMSFHGGLVGIIIGVLIFSKKRSIKSFILLDVIACVAPIGLFFGRIANFINGELYGKPSEQFWSVIFLNVDNIPRHPSQLYEAFLEGFLLFIILFFIILKKKYKDGFCSSIFLIFYGFFRIIAEQFREPDTQIGLILNHFSMGTVLSFIMIIFGFLILIKLKNNEQST